MNKLDGSSFLSKNKPKKLIFLLHGYGDHAENFILLARYLNEDNLEINFYAPNAPFSVPQFSQGRQWFDPYPKGIHYNDVGAKEKKIMQDECETSIKLLNEYIHNLCLLNNMTFKECFVIGFSQGAMIAYEYGKYMNNTLSGCVMLSGRILSSQKLENNMFVKTPLMIIHGDNDEVVNSKYFDESCRIAKSSGFSFEHHLIEGEGHTIPLKTLQFTQNFIKKYM